MMWVMKLTNYDDGGGRGFLYLLCYATFGATSVSDAFPSWDSINLTHQYHATAATMTFIL